MKRSTISNDVDMTGGNWDIWLGSVEILMVIPVKEFAAKSSQEKESTSHTFV